MEDGLVPHSSTNQNQRRDQYYWTRQVITNYYILLSIYVVCFIHIKCRVHWNMHLCFTTYFLGNLIASIGVEEMGLNNTEQGKWLPTMYCFLLSIYVVCFIRIKCRVHWNIHLCFTMYCFGQPYCKYRSGANGIEQYWTRQVILTAVFIVNMCAMLLW